MTLNDILVSALAQLDRGHDAQTMEVYRDRLMDYANDAQSDIARAICFTRKETVTPSNGLVDLGTLSYDCIKVVKAEQLGREVRFIQSQTGLIALPYNERATITYRCEPKRLLSPTDVSELPAHTHGLMTLYIVGRERMAGDQSTQSGANIYLSMYEAAKARLRPHVGESRAYEITNRWEA
ncbi:MAG: hypothetical protein K6G56_07430 [Clostridiales bacterium]|nr:hypothetical protein [Clostridiales bacterium]